MSTPTSFEHADVVEPHHRFPEIQFGGSAWDLSHLDAFAIRFDPGVGHEIDIVILFSCHCFTHSLQYDGRPVDEIPEEEIYDDGIERRVLCEDRYALSRVHLRQVISQLHSATIRFGEERGQNFFTTKCIDDDGAGAIYTIFFEVTKDKKRPKRMLLHVQSAYRQVELKKRLRNAGKIRFATLVRAAYEGRIVHQ